MLLSIGYKHPHTWNGYFNETLNLLASLFYALKTQLKNSFSQLWLLKKFSIKLMDYFLGHPVCSKKREEMDVGDCLL